MSEQVEPLSTDEIEGALRWHRERLEIHVAGHDLPPFDGVAGSATMIRVLENLRLERKRALGMEEALRHIAKESFSVPDRVIARRALGSSTESFAREDT